MALVFSIPGSARARDTPSTENEESPEQLYYQRIIAKIEPDLVGRPERLSLYIALFRREMITDPRVFPFRVEADWAPQGRIVLRGFVGYRENRTALLKFLHYLGFERVDDQIEVLPSKRLGAKRFGFVKGSHSLSLDQPTGRQQVLTDCLLGTPVYLLREAAGGFFLCQGVEGYVGYMKGKDIHRVDRKEFARYQAGAQLRVRRDVRVADSLFVPLGARLKCVGRRDAEVAVELPTGEEAILPGDSCQVRDGSPDSRINRVIENASRMLGTKYLWGGNTSEGIDCSGLMQTAFAAEGILLPRDANQQIYPGSLTATRWYRDGLRRGDTLYFLGSNGKVSHTAIYLGGGRYLEAVQPAVRRNSFNQQDEEYDQRRDAAFCFAKRLLD